MNLFITVGVPRSGKSTWAREKARTLGNTLLFSRDDLRASLYGGISSYRFTKEKEEMITRIEEDGVRFALASGKNVIVHDTNLKGDIDKWHKVAIDCGADFHVEYFDVGMPVLLERNHKSGADAIPIHRMWDMYEKYRTIRRWVKASALVDTSLPECVIFDVDGTLFNMGQRSPYDMTRVYDDPPNLPVQELLRMYRAAGKKIVIVTGRTYSEQCSEDTQESILKCNCPFDDFFMREAEDKRPDIEVKEEILRKYILPKYNPILAVDDRDTPVGMWRMNGIPCFQVNYGDF